MRGNSLWRGLWEFIHCRPLKYLNTDETNDRKGETTLRAGDRAFYQFLELTIA